MSRGGGGGPRHTGTRLTVIVIYNISLSVEAVKALSIAISPVFISQ